MLVNDYALRFVDTYGMEYGQFGNTGRAWSEVRDCLFKLVICHTYQIPTVEPHSTPSPCQLPWAPLWFVLCARSLLIKKNKTGRGTVPNDQNRSTQAQPASVGDEMSGGGFGVEGWLRSKNSTRWGILSIILSVVANAHWRNRNLAGGASRANPAITNQMVPLIRESELHVAALSFLALPHVPM